MPALEGMAINYTPPLTGRGDTSVFGPSLNHAAICQMVLVQTFKRTQTVSTVHILHTQQRWKLRHGYIQYLFPQRNVKNRSPLDFSCSLSHWTWCTTLSLKICLVVTCLFPSGAYWSCSNTSPSPLISAESLKPLLTVWVGVRAVTLSARTQPGAPAQQRGAAGAWVRLEHPGTVLPWQPCFNHWITQTRQPLINGLILAPSFLTQL